MRILLFFVCLLVTISAGAVTTEEYLIAKGYSTTEIKSILQGGQGAKDEIDMRYRLGMLGYSEKEIQNEIGKRFPHSKLALNKFDKLPEKKVAAILTRKEIAVLNIVEEAAELQEIPKALILAVIRAESAFDRIAKSSAGARGMMQLMEKTAYEIGVTDRLDARENIMGGTKYLRMMLDRFGGNLDLALAAYNAGPDTVEKAGWRVPNYPAVHKYINDVKRFYDHYS